MAALFSTPKFPDVPRIEDPEIAEERRRQLALASGGGRQSTVISGSRGVQGPILGSAASLTGDTL